MIALLAQAEISDFIGGLIGNGQIEIKGQSFVSDPVELSFNIAHNLPTYENRFYFKYNNQQIILRANITDITFVNNVIYLGNKKVGDIKGNHKLRLSNQFNQADKFFLA